MEYICFESSVSSIEQFLKHITGQCNDSDQDSDKAKAFSVSQYYDRVKDFSLDSMFKRNGSFFAKIVNG